MGAARERWPRSLRIFKAALETTIASHGKPMRPYGSKNPGDDDDLTNGCGPAASSGLWSSNISTSPGSRTAKR